MDRIEPDSIGNILRKVFMDTGMKQQLDERKAVKLWPSLMGEEIASLCGLPEVRKGVMTVGVRNASLRHELTMNRTQIKKSINHAIGNEIITEIRFIS